MARTAALVAAAAAAAATAASLSGTTCATNGTACPPPAWPAEWNLTRSTICQPSSSGYFLPPPSQPWGLVSLDWSVARSIWDAAGPANGTIEATSIHGCALLKQSGAASRCFIYHNMELALQAQESQRAVMYDPTKAGMFLQYTDGKGNKNGTIYNEPGGPGDQFFWDFRVPSASAYYISSVLNTTTASEWVDGSFTDDVTGLPAEHEHAPANMRLSPEEVADIQAATAAASAALIDAAVAAGRYIWQAFGAQDGVGSGPSRSSCASWMRARCGADYQGRAITQALDGAAVNQSIASFLITRPPVAFLGFGWESDQRFWRPEFLWQVGEPAGLCAEGPAGVFSRRWSAGDVTLDCNSWTASIPLVAPAPVW